MTPSRNPRPTPRRLRIGASYALVGGCTLVAQLDADACGGVFVAAGQPIEYVLRDSTTAGEACLALWERRRQPRAGGSLTVVYVPTDFTLEDLRELHS